MTPSSTTSADVAGADSNEGARGAADAATPSEPFTLELPAGLIGLPGARRFSVQAFAGEEIVELVSLDEPGLGFVAAPADSVRSGMSEELRARGFTGPSETLLVLLSVHGSPPVVTANLAGPLAVDRDARTARQLVLEGPEFPLRQPLGGTD